MVRMNSSQCIICVSSISCRIQGKHQIYMKIPLSGCRGQALLLVCGFQHSYMCCAVYTHTCTYTYLVDTVVVNTV